MINFSDIAKKVLILTSPLLILGGSSTAKDICPYINPDLLNRIERSLQRLDLTTNLRFYTLNSSCAEAVFYANSYPFQLITAKVDNYDGSLVISIGYYNKKPKDNLEYNIADANPPVSEDYDLLYKKEFISTEEIAVLRERYLETGEEQILTIMYRIDGVEKPANFVLIFDNDNISIAFIDYESNTKEVEA